MENAAFNCQQHVAGEIRRMLARQKELPVESIEYAQLMANMEVLSRGADLYEDIEGFLSAADEGITAIEIVPGGKTEPEDEDEEATESVASVPAEEHTPDPAPDPADSGKTYEMTEVRAALVAARKNGVNVTELLHEFGVENFSAFPAGRYGELMDKLGVV